jgi:energy-coupling factor transporter ATP-binding protein EcfA2
MIQASQVSFRYPNANRGLAPVSLQVQPGEAVLITGPSGSGKSTLARCLTGIIPHLYRGTMTGEVQLNGSDTADQPMWQLAEHAGMVFQNPASQMLAPSVEDEILFGLENLGLPKDEITSRLEAVLDQFNLSSMRSRPPQTLSGGEQQKLALASIVARRPDFLVLDEPLSMLDSTAAMELVQYLERQIQDGRSLIILEHRREFLEAIKNLRVVDLDGYHQHDERFPLDLNLPPKERFQLEMEEVSVHLGGRAILDDLNLTLQGGQLIALVGRNGVGKTTLLRTLAGLQKFKGRVSVETPNGQVAPDLGLAFQNPDLQIFNPTVRDEILYRLPDPDMEQYHRLLNTLGLAPYEQTPPLLLSEGEKNRLALALVLMHNPAHGILLDEPSLGQDAAHKRVLIRLLRTLVDAGQLVVMTTHDLTLASQANRLILLGNEGVIVDGPTDVVLQDKAAWQQAGIVFPDWFLKGQGRGDPE